MKTILQAKAKISKKMALEKIVAHSLFGDHHHEPRPRNTAEVEIFFRQAGIDPNELIQRMRDPSENLPYFENLIGSTWEICGGKAEVLNDAGEVETLVEGPGQISLNSCQSHFETAAKARDRAISESGYQHLYECLTFGFASIEAYFYFAAGRWNRKNPNNQLIDNKSNKVSLETKIVEWIPIISGGKAFDRTNRQWSDFKTLKRIRDRNAIHPGSGGQGMTYKEMAKYLNEFRHGIAHLLGNLHILLSTAVPAVIINAIYHPDIEVVKVEERS